MLKKKDEMLSVDVCLGIREPDVPELVDGGDNGESRNNLFRNLLGAAAPFHPRLSLLVREVQVTLVDVDDLFAEGHGAKKANAEVVAEHHDAWGVRIAHAASQLSVGVAVLRFEEICKGPERDFLISHEPNQAPNFPTTAKWCCR